VNKEQKMPRVILFRPGRGKRIPKTVYVDTELSGIAWRGPFSPAEAIRFLEWEGHCDEGYVRAAALWGPAADPRDVEPPDWTAEPVARAGWSRRDGKKIYKQEIGLLRPVGEDPNGDWLAIFSCWSGGPSAQERFSCIAVADQTDYAAWVNECAEMAGRGKHYAAWADPWPGNPARASR